MSEAHAIQPLVERGVLVEDMADWVALGIERGWCSKPSCSSHDGIPMTAEEALEMETNKVFDPCHYIVRLWGD